MPNFPLPASVEILTTDISGTVLNKFLKQMAATTVGGGSAVGLAAGVATLGSLNGQGNLAALAGAPIAGNAADTTDDILGGFQLPANLFDVANRSLLIEAFGLTGATTNNKRFKIFVNPTMSGETIANGIISGGHVTAGTPLVDSGAWANGTTANNAAGWSAAATITKYGAAGSNTQVGLPEFQTGILAPVAGVPVALTTPENAVINIVVTGSSYTTGAAGDVNLWGLAANFQN